MCHIPVGSMSRSNLSPAPAVSTSEVEEMLRETAFVLQMTRLVKDAILERKPLAGPTPRQAWPRSR